MKTPEGSPITPLVKPVSTWVGLVLAWFLALAIVCAGACVDLRYTNGSTLRLYISDGVLEVSWSPEAQSLNTGTTFSIRPAHPIIATTFRWSRRYAYANFMVPTWVVGLPVAICICLATAVRGRVQLRHQRLVTGRCGNCGYDLRGSPGLVCSECGNEAESDAAGRESILRKRALFTLQLGMLLLLYLGMWMFVLLGGLGPKYHLFGPSTLAGGPLSLCFWLAIGVPRHNEGTMLGVHSTCVVLQLFVVRFLVLRTWFGMAPLAWNVLVLATWGLYGLAVGLMLALID